MSTFSFEAQNPFLAGEHLNDFFHDMPMPLTFHTEMPLQVSAPQQTEFRLMDTALASDTSPQEHHFETVVPPPPLATQAAQAAPPVVVPDHTGLPTCQITMPVITAPVVQNSMEKKPAARGYKRKSPPADADDAQQKRARKLARKATLARMARHRKKMKLETLSSENDKLRAELRRVKEQSERDQALLRKLKVHGQVTLSDTDTMNDCISHLINVADSDASRPGSPNISGGSSSESESVSSSSTELPAAVDSILNVFEHKKAMTNYFLDSLERTVDDVSALQMKFFKWVMTRPDSFYTMETAGLWRSVFREQVDASDPQVTELLALRTMVQQQEADLLARTSLLDCTFKQLRLTVQERVIADQSNFKELASILRPSQLANLCKWVAQFGEVVIKC